MAPSGERFLHPAALRPPQRDPIPLRLGRWGGKLFLECAAVQPFLAHLGVDRDGREICGAHMVRGVITPGLGAILECFDSMGSSCGEMITLTNAAVDTLILRSLIWRIVSDS